MTFAPFSRSVLLRHITYSLLSRTFLCGVILVSMMEILGLLEMTTPILERQLGAIGLVKYALLKLPSLTAQTLPLTTLIGALFMFMQLTLNSEMASLRAAGLSTKRLILLLLPSVGIISLFGIAALELAAPRAELELAKWWNQTDPHAAGSGHGFWFHTAGTIAHIDSFSQGGYRVHNIAVYHRTADGDLTSTDTAPEASYHDATGWESVTSRTLTVHSDKVTIANHKDVILLPKNVTPDTLIELSQNYPVLSSWSIWKILHRGAASSLSKATYRMIFFTPFILPITLCAMLFLALPVVYIPPRAGTKSLLPVASLAAGFGFIVLQGLIQALGNAGTLPAIVAVMVPPALAFLLGGAWIVKMEDK